ncbi:MAG: hypothetical protein WAZ27_00840 [Minisyncoccia bacterium]
MLSRKDTDFLQVIAAEQGLGTDAAKLVRDLLQAQEALKRLSLTQRLKLVSLATQHQMSHVRVTGY